MADISLTIGGVSKLFDLAKSEGRKQFSTKEEPIIPPRALLEVPTYQDLPPERILAFVQNTWQGGMGQKDHFKISDMYADGQGIDTKEPDQIILGPKISTITGAPSIIALHSFKEQEYAIGTRYVYKYTTDWTTVLDVGVADTIECINHYDDRIYIGLTTGKYYYSSTGDSDSWTQCTLANAVAHELVVAPPFSGSKDILVLATRPNIVRTAIAPLNDQAGWLDPPYYIGDTSSNITSLFILNGTLLIGKEDGLYALPIDGRPVLLLSFKEQRSSANFAYHTNWQGITYIAAAGDIMEIISTASTVFHVDYVGPLHKSPELAKMGSVVGITNDDKNLYAIFKIGSEYVIYTGRERRDTKYGLRWEWVPYIYLGTTECKAIKVMQRDNQNPKLWLGYGNDTQNVLLPLAPNLPLGDPNYRFTSSGHLITSYFDGGYDTWNKLFYQLWTITENLVVDSRYIKVYYQADTDTSWTYLTVLSSNGVHAVNLPPLSGQKFRLKFELYTTNDTKTPILREFIFRGTLQPELVKTLDFTVVLSQSNSRKPSTDLAFLESGRIATSPIVLKDLRFGTTRNIIFLPNSPMEMEVFDEVAKQPTYAARILAQQLNWSPP